MTSRCDTQAAPALILAADLADKPISGGSGCGQGCWPAQRRHQAHSLQHERPVSPAAARAAVSTGSQPALASLTCSLCACACWAVQHSAQASLAARLNSCGSLSCRSQLKGLDCISVHILKQRLSLLLTAERLDPAYRAVQPPVSRAPKLQSVPEGAPSMPGLSSGQAAVQSSDAPRCFSL